VTAIRAATLFFLPLWLAACASVPELDRQMLRSEREPVRLEGSHGALTRAQSQKILDDLRKRSPDTNIFSQHVAVEEKLTDTQLSVGNKVTLLEDGKATYAAMLAAIRTARDHVHIESYIFEGDEVGEEFARALVERRRAGVKVRVMYDSVGSIDTPKEFFAQLKDAGVEVVEYNPVNTTTVLTEGLRLNHRDHRKLTIVDGRVAFLGGINISSVYTPSGGSGSGGSGASGGGSSSSSGSSGKPKKELPYADKPWRDTAVRLEGPVVADLQRAFVEMWQSQTKTPLESRGLFPQLKPAGPSVVRAIEASPEKGPNPLYVALISAIESAEKSVHITNAYFVPHPQLVAALKAAARRGVDVRMILPSKTDSWLVLAAGRSYYQDLLESGVHIYERKSRLLHAKTAVVDEVWATVGSTNLDWRSLSTNSELNAVVLGPDFAVQMEAVFQQDISHSEEITREAWAGRPLADRAREAAARAWILAL
jgi:Phosphatidylserine/phosphatidylglycerophosphate/cardiolipin synthases and related enzymes